jgi:NADH-quinone oxidoreductase subunit D
MELIEKDLDNVEFNRERDTMLLNVGPNHPCTHGTVRMVLELTGETIERCDVQVGYSHRGVEKMCERGTWSQVLPYVERCNYASPMLNNVGFALACEKLLGVTVPERCQYYRMILGEFARISDHLTCLGVVAMDLGAFTPYLWMIRCREMIGDLMEEETGARLTHSFARIGGIAKPPTDGLKGHTRSVCEQLLQSLDEVQRLLIDNRIFLDRLENVGGMSAENAISLGCTGPVLRACGVPYDVRRAHPYLKYDELEFDVPVGEHGDCFDRFMVRLEEIRQSTRIIEQCVARIPCDGPVNIEDPRIVLPQKSTVYSTGDGKAQHVRLVMDGIKLPRGEVYSYTEGGNGEMGFYLVSDGSDSPYRVHLRSPSFFNTSGLEHVLRGQMISDMVPCFGTLNVNGGETDR